MQLLIFPIIVYIIYLIDRHFSVSKKVTVRIESKQKSLPKSKYREYINSQTWKERAKKIRKRDKHVCRLCYTNKEELHVHHATYERLGVEDDNDLITLCASCHNKFHNR